MVVKNLAIFIMGGIVTTFLIAPILTSTIPILLLLFLSLVMLFFIIPGGWFLSWLTFRTASLSLRFKIGRFVLGLIVVSLVGLIIGITLGHLARDIFLFVSGGFVTLFSFTRLIEESQKRVSKISEVKVGGLRDRRFLGEGLAGSDLRGGVLVTGDKCVDVARALIKNIVENGFRVVVIGESSRIIPEGVKVRGGVADKIDVVGDMLNDHRCVESFTYAYALANRLRNDDVALLMNACIDNLVEIRAGKLELEEFFKMLPDKIQDRRANIIKTVVNVTDWFSRDGLRLTEVEGDWQVLYVSVRGLPYRQAMFSMAYVILTLNLDAVLVIHSPELLVKDVNLLAYDSREPWERLFNALDDWREAGGLVLVSKSPILSQQTLHLCQIHVASRMSEYFKPLDERTRRIYEASKTLKDGEVVVYNSRGVFKLKLKIPDPANIPPPKKVTVTVSGGVRGRVGESMTFEEKAEPAPTLLEKMFGEKVIDAARILERARDGLANVSEKDKELVRELEEKGLITSLGGVCYTSATGEEALSEYQKAVKDRGHLIKKTPVEEPRVEESKIRESGTQMIIDSEKASSRMDECVATYYVAESLFRQGKYGHCVMNCYEFMVNALKKFYQIERGHLDDIVEMLSKKGAETGLTIQEARDAKTLLIEASNSLREGKHVPLTSAQRMLKYARKVLEALQKTGGDGDEV